MIRWALTTMPLNDDEPWIFALVETTHGRCVGAVCFDCTRRSTAPVMFDTITPEGALA